MVRDYMGREPSIPDSAFVAEGAVVTGDVTLGEESSVWYNATIRGDVDRIRIGARSNVQDGAVLHVVTGGPCVLGDEVTVGHGAIVHACEIGDRCLVGMGAIILDFAVVGSDSIVGAGALVTGGKRFPPRSMILGSPAKAVRPVTDEEVEAIRKSAARYVLVARRTRQGGDDPA